MVGLEILQHSAKMLEFQIQHHALSKGKHPSSTSLENALATRLLGILGCERVSVLRAVPLCHREFKMHWARKKKKKSKEHNGITYTGGNRTRVPVLL